MPRQGLEVRLMNLRSRLRICWRGISDILLFSFFDSEIPTVLHYRADSSHSIHIYCSGMGFVENIPWPL